MPSPIQITFGRPQDGWIETTLTPAEGTPLKMRSSYTPYDSIADLVTALAAVLKDLPTAKVSWNEEPTQYEFCFTTHNGYATLTITRHPDHRRIASQGTEVAKITATDLDMCLPFWRALRRLQSLVSDEEYKIAWRGPFPVQKLEEVTRLIHDRPAARG